MQRSLELRPDAEVTSGARQGATRQARGRKLSREREPAIFTLRYSGEAEPGLAHEVLRALESILPPSSRNWNYTPARTDRVILYTQQAFPTSPARPLVGALNDGRIRVRCKG